MANNIPSLGGSEISSFLYDTTKDIDGEGLVVECGSWLGASIKPVARALADIDSEIKIHCYDRWNATRGEVERAKSEGVELTKGQNLLPIFLDNTQDIYPYIVPHRTDLLEAEWIGEPIELYIDDANKDPQLFKHAMTTFGPHFIPGKTILVLMDYKYYDKSDSSVDKKLKECQKDFIEENRNCFQQVATFGEIPGAAFRYVSPVDWREPILQTWTQRIYSRNRIVRWLAWEAIDRKI